MEKKKVKLMKENCRRFVCKESGKVVYLDPMFNRAYYKIHGRWTQHHAEIDWKGDSIKAVRLY